MLPPSGKADIILLIDPDDGTRIKEKSTITMVGVPGNIPNPTFADIQFAVIRPLNEDTRPKGTYYTKKIDGVDTVFYKDDIDTISSAVSLKRENPLSPTNFSFGYESYSASPDFSGVILRHLQESDEDADDINVQVSFPSGSGSMLDIIKGERDIYVDPRDMLFKEFAGLPVKIGRRAKGAYPMDVAAGAFMLKALEAEVTNGKGEPLNDHYLWAFNEDGTWSDECQLSVVAARTPKLHAEAKRRVNNGMDELRKLHRRQLRNPTSFFHMD